MMKRRMTAVVLALALALTLTACGGGEETTLTGMVTAVEGTVVSVMEMDGQMGGMDFDFAEGERPEMPEDMTMPEGMEGFDPGQFGGMPPDGENFPQWEEGEAPDFPEDVTMPEDMPEDMTLPEGMPMPEDGEMPDFEGGPSFAGGFDNFEFDGETTDVDIADAHISVEIEGGKEGGSLESVTPGSFVTVTLDGKGQATYVLVSRGFGFNRQ